MAPRGLAVTLAVAVGCGGVTSGDPRGGEDAGGGAPAGGASGFGGSIGGTSSGGSAGLSGSGGSSGCEPLASCEGVCTNLLDDAAHCGGCFVICGQAQYCQSGLCKTFPCHEVIEAEDETKVKRTSGWLQAYGGVCHAGVCLETASQVSSDSLAFGFYGTGLVVYYTRGPNRGDLTVSIDGQDAAYIEGHVDLDFQFQTPAVVVLGLPFGSHTALLQCVPGSGYCDVDYFAAICP
jgi:hypothetical protein